MKRILAAVALMACLPIANAQDKGKSDFTHDAEFRVRDTFEQNELGNSGSKTLFNTPAQHNGIDQRFKLGLGFKANEKFSLGVTLLQSASWGQQDVTPGSVGNRGIVSPNPFNADEQNFMSVNQAYANWMMREDFWMRFGRTNFSFGDGSVMSVNDWETQPLSFDGVTAHYELEFGRFEAFAFKYRDFYGQGLASTSGDPQHDAYGLIFDLKSPMPEWLKMVNAYVIQDVADGVGTTAPVPASTVQTLQNSNALRYGVLGSAAFQMVDLKLGYNMVSGKNSDVIAGVAQTAPADPERTISSSMLNFEVGVNLPNLMASRIFVGYHQDSGTKQSATPADRTSDKTYDPYFYDRRTSAGMMEVVGWGNLTDISLGWTVKPSDMTEAGLGFHMLSKTEKEDFIYGGTYGYAPDAQNHLFGLGACDPNGAAGNPACKSAIGNEIDVWAEHKYDGGLSMFARAGMFMPGDQLKDSVYNRGSTITQVSVQGKLVF